MGKVKKVLFTSHTANFQKFNRPFMRMLSKQGYEVHYASMGEEEILDCDKSFTVPFTRSPFRLSNIKAYKQLKRIIDRENYDIIHTHTPMGSVVTRLAARDARKKGTRIIYTAHGFHFFTGAPLANWLIYYPVEKWMARHTDTLITINNEDYERAKRKFKTDVRHVPGVGIDPKRFGIDMTKAEKTKLRKSLGLKDSDFVMIYVAELSKRKNQLWLVRTLASFIKLRPDTYLLLPGKDSLGEKLHNLVEELGLQGHVHLLGYREDIPQLMRVSNLALSSSKQEGLPVNIMEAMYLGLPIVATDCRGNRDLAQNSSSGRIVAQGDADAFAQAIEWAYTARADWKEAIEPYMLDSVANEMKKIYTRKPIILHLLASNQYSGAENVASEIIRTTDPSRFDSYYVSPGGTIDSALEKKGIKHIIISRLSYSEVRRVIREYKPSIVHAHDFRASILASYFAREAKIISHIHQNPIWMNKINHKSLFYRSRLNVFKKILIVTDIMRNNYAFRGASQERIITLHNILDVDRIRQLGDETLDKTYDIVFCGRLEDVKQPIEFLEVVRAIRPIYPNVQAVIVGDGSLRSRCEGFIEANGLADNVELAGFQINPYKYIKNSTYLVLTSKEEGFGLVAIEAVIVGTPVIAYNLASIRELLDESAFLLDGHRDVARELTVLLRSKTKNQKTLKKQKAALAEFFRGLDKARDTLERAYLDL